MRFRECSTTGNKAELIDPLYENDSERLWMREYQKQPGVDATVQNGGTSELKLVERENETLLQELTAAKKQIQGLKRATARHAQKAQS